MHWFIEVVGKSKTFVPHIYLFTQKQEAKQDIVHLFFQSSCDGGFDCFMSPIAPEDAAGQYDI